MNRFAGSDYFQGLEIHLADKPPTSLADVSKFGTVSDDSDPGQNRYYKTANNLPWAIHVIETFDYPKEKSVVTEGYLNFGAWAEAAGQMHVRWFRDETGNRNEEHIYSK